MMDTKFWLGERFNSFSDSTFCMEYIIKVLRGNRLTIPHEEMKRINLKIGDFLIVTQQESGLLVRKAKFSLSEE